MTVQYHFFNFFSQTLTNSEIDGVTTQNRCKKATTKIAAAQWQRLSSYGSRMSRLTASKGGSSGTDFVTIRRTTSLLLMRTGCKSMRLLPGGLTWSESARGRCCRSFGLARCVLQTLICGCDTGSAFFMTRVSK